LSAISSGTRWSTTQVTRTIEGLNKERKRREKEGKKRKKKKREEKGG